MSQEISKLSFSDFDEFSTQAQQWDLNLRQLDAGSFQAELLQFAVDDVQISEAKFSRTIRQYGVPPVGLRTVVVPAVPNFEFQWRGTRIDSNSLMVFPLGAELEALSKSNFHVFTCSFPASLLSDVANSLGVPDLDDLTGDVVQCSDKRMSYIRRLLKRICAKVGTDPTLLGTSGLTECIVSDLPQRIIRASMTPVGDAEHLTTSTKRMRILKSAEDFIEHRVREPITVADVCEAAQTSVRTLQVAFAEKYGISPKAYIRAIRLNVARRFLRSADPKVQRVADVANDCGFWHLGQFAADYQRHFGELPSTTLRRTR